MRVTINTHLLQSLLTRSIKGVGNNKLMPITSMIAIEVKNNTLCLITTDGVNYLYIKNDIEAEDFYAVVDANVFFKLVSKTTSDNIVLRVSDNFEIVGNGEYTMELPLDEDGTPVKFPDPASNVSNTFDGGEISKPVVTAILQSLKPSLAVTNEEPQLMGYYASDCVVASDGYKIAYMKVDMLKSPRLISPETMNLLDVMPDDKVSVALSTNSNVMLFKADNFVLYSIAMQYIEDYSIDVITSFVEDDFASTCKVSRTDLSSLLERLALFVTAYDKNVIKLVFTEKGLQVSSKSANAIETVEYRESKNHADYVCYVNVDLLLGEVKACTGDVVDIQYGEEAALKFVDGNTVQICALSSAPDA